MKKPWKNLGNLTHPPFLPPGFGAKKWTNKNKKHSVSLQSCICSQPHRLSHTIQPPAKFCGGRKVCNPLKLAKKTALLKNRLIEPKRKGILVLQKLHNFLGAYAVNVQGPGHLCGEDLNIWGDRQVLHGEIYKKFMIWKRKNLNEHSLWIQKTLTLEGFTINIGLPAAKACIWWGRLWNLSWITLKESLEMDKLSKSTSPTVAP